MKKAFFFDIDGTLVHEENNKLVVSEKNQHAIHKLRQQGHKTFIATGRIESFIPESIFALEMDGLVTANGSVVRIGEKIVHKRPLPTGFVKKILEFCKQHNHPWLFEGDLAYVDDLNSEQLNYFCENVIVNRDNIIKVDDVMSLNTYNALLMGKDIDVDLLQREVSENYIVAEHLSHGYLDCYYKHSTKADGIKKVIEYLNLEDYQTYAFGDGNNDIQMFEEVDVSVAMQNASPKLKEKATHITLYNHQSGVAEALERLKLI